MTCKLFVRFNAYFAVLILKYILEEPDSSAIQKPKNLEAKLHLNRRFFWQNPAWQHLTSEIS